MIRRPLKLTLASSFRLLLVVGIGVVALSLTISRGYSASAEEITAVQMPRQWTRTLSGSACPALPSDTNCHLSSPAIADINGDNKPDIVVATNSGRVIVVKHDGSQLWSVDVAAHFGMAAGTNQIHSSPAVGDIDNDGFPDIVVGVGDINNSCTHGGVIALSHTGAVKAGWPKWSQDYIAPHGCRDTVFSSPALGDLTKDGKLEIVVGSFDKRVYVWRHDGSLLPGFPLASYHTGRFPTWPNLKDRLADTVWSSPALGDINGDGYLDIVIGSDEGNYDARYGGDAAGWTCPYATMVPGYCGGSLYVFDRFGNHLPGFPKYIHEIIQSTPVLADLDQNGSLDIIVGTGSWYHNNSSDHPTLGFRVYAWDKNGNSLPGWEGGKTTGHVVPAPPVVGDITGNGQLEVIVGAQDKRLYAWQSNGQTVSGFPMTPRDFLGGASAHFDIGRGLVLADYTGNGKMEILFTQAWGVTIVAGNGQQLTTSAAGDPLPAFTTDGLLINTPAVADLNGNGRLELIASNSKLVAWELPNSSTLATWPMFKRNAARTSAVPTPPRLEVGPDSLFIMHPANQGGSAQATILIRNSGGGSLNWNASGPAGVTITPNSGVILGGASRLVTVTVAAGNYGNGTHQIGSLSVVGTSGGSSPALNSPASLSITLYKGTIHRNFLPATMR
jgi:hypothetical protein